MRHRKKVGGRKDARIFRHTAMKTKKINVAPKVSRGGIQLWKKGTFGNEIQRWNIFRKSTISNTKI